MVMSECKLSLILAREAAYWVRSVLFVKPINGQALSPTLVKRIQDAIRDRLSRRHVPAKIIECQGECSSHITLDFYRLTMCSGQIFPSVSGC